MPQLWIPKGGCAASPPGGWTPLLNCRLSAAPKEQNTGSFKNEAVLRHFFTRSKFQNIWAHEFRKAREFFDTRKIQSFESSRKGWPRTNLNIHISGDSNCLVTSKTRWDIFSKLKLKKNDLWRRHSTRGCDAWGRLGDQTDPSFLLTDGLT